MGERRETLVDIEGLASSLNRKLGTLQPYSKRRCIYRIPKRIRELNGKACTPQVVSIGPLHYGRKNLKVMEEYKERSLKDFLERTKARVEEFLQCIKDKEVNLRECYAEPIRLNSEAFVKMILVDAAFLIEYFLFFIETEYAGRFAVPSASMRIDIMSDVLKLENQLPLFILKDLVDRAMTAMSTEGLSTSKLAFNLSKIFLGGILSEEKLIKAQSSSPKHFLDWLRLCLEPPNYEAEIRRQARLKTIPSISELQQAGVKFKSVSSEDLFDIRFENGILKIPKLTVVEQSEILLINFIALEQLDGRTNFVNDYVLIISKLLQSRRDEEILVGEGIIDTFFWEEEEATALFHKLGGPSTIYTNNFYYSNLAESLNAHLRNPWNEWKANLRQNYFKTPWATISVIAAAALLILTFIQAVCSILAL